MSNTDLWDSVERTDPKHVKAITGKSYQGTSPKPHYLVRKATETFGPCGIGWGFNIVSERIEEGAGGEKMHIAHVRLWYKWNGETGIVEHVGGTQFSGIRSSGKPFTDEDAPKKSITDALVKALSMVGFAGDIFMGRYDDSKYLDEVKAEFAEDKPEPAADAPQLPKRFSKNESRQTYADLQKVLDEAQSLNDLKSRWESAMPIIKTLPVDWEKELTVRKDTCKAALMKAAQGLNQIKAPSFDNLDTSPDPLEELLDANQGDN